MNKYLEIVKQTQAAGNANIVTYLSGEQAGQSESLEKFKEKYPNFPQDWEKKNPFLYVQEDLTVFYEMYHSLPRLFIYGAGHVGQALAKILQYLDYQVIVIDPRPEFANAANFPPSTLTVAQEFSDFLDSFQPRDSDSHIIMTSGHKSDIPILAHLIQGPYRYLGMMGSKNKVKTSKATVCEMLGRDVLFDSLHAPIGLAIGAETPTEIAISIAAELVSESKKNIVNIVEYPFLNALRRIDPANDDFMVLTVIESQGSGPREAGAKLLLSKQKGIVAGTIGGGSVEHHAILHAHEMLEAKEAFSIKHYNLGPYSAENIGMLCGGSSKVMFELI